MGSGKRLGEAIRVVSLPEEWSKAYAVSDRRFKDAGLQRGNLDICRREDGTLCPFSRGIMVRNILYITCILSKCVRRYPTIDDIHKSGNK